MAEADPCRCLATVLLRYGPSAHGIFAATGSFLRAGACVAHLERREGSVVDLAVLKVAALTAFRVDGGILYHGVRSLSMYVRLAPGSPDQP